MSKDQNPFQAMALTSGILSQLAGCSLIGIFIGRWADDYFSTSPLFLIVGLLIGLAAGTYGTIYLVRKYTGEDVDVRSAVSNNDETSKKMDD
ncbi:AtpZ/AtpI family protein [Pontibacillus litoralis]|uniref:Membrane protein n=1 Tax=Pontibacillus litoralis JSM 072002 TaxID=1385512 RepID=A0A0A5HS44_9BACI|nr:AtpZ/AtpI family protein [Pontibacillus litoralis]KGX86447.1 membrane protein [Pontibacillus litoralis JSM 072002]